MRRGAMIALGVIAVVAVAAVLFWPSESAADFVPYCASHRTTYTACVQCAEERAGEVCGVDPSGACRETIRQLETAWCLEMNP